MKVFGLLVCVAASVATTTTHAANCTIEQIGLLTTLPEVSVAITACGVTLASAANLNQTSLCNAKCLSALDAAIKVMPACELAGNSITGTYTAVVAGCKSSSTSAARSIHATTATSLLIMTVAMASALVGVALAVV